jgi:hypothetical protein
VQNQPYLSLSPYPGLGSTVSLQAWAHQLKVDSAADPRIQEFITALRQNRWVYPEAGATCQEPGFDITNPPPFDPTPPGPDAIPMTGNGGSTATTDVSATPKRQSPGPTATPPVTTAPAVPSGAPVSANTTGP